MNLDNGSLRHPDTWRGTLAETGLIFLLFFVLAGGLPPDVNEAHYLAKAKHYWDPSWCRGDFFLESSDAHLVFYWSVGWLTRLMPLSAAAWVGRGLVWLLLAWSWRRLSWALIPHRLYALLTAGLFTGLLRWGHMSGEWVVGGVEAKGFAYGLALLALEALVAGYWRRVWLLLGAAAAFHVVVGGWSAVAASFAWLVTKDRPGWRSQCWAWLGCLFLALPGIVPAVALSWGVDAETVRAANEIYVFERLPHHLVFHGLPPAFMARHAALLLVWLMGLRQVASLPGSRRLRAFVGGAVLIAAAGILIDLALTERPAPAAALLRYYWFRLSDVMLPLGVAFVLAEGIVQLARNRSAASSWCLCAAILLAGGHVSIVAREHWQEVRPGAVCQTLPRRDQDPDELLDRFRAWQSTCAWIAGHTPPEAIFLSPRYQQSFKWYASRAEVVNWKDIPQDARGIVAWKDRMQDVYQRGIDPSLPTEPSDVDLQRLARRYGFAYVVVDCARSIDRPSFPRVYPPLGEIGAWYEVYRLPESVEHGGSKSNAP